ncbi:MAG TPA: DUF3325 domain-containing protein [Pseudoxanthomonas sp.]|nr:DUF3325 domain-containing protein [Pseudoxanthomonas sp.]
MILIALLLATAAFVCLALAMERHHRHVTGHVPGVTRRHLLKTFGWAALFVSLAACIDAWGVAQGLIGWCGVMAVGACATLLWISFRSPAGTSRPRSIFRS